MIDFHSHIIPEIDDGSISIEDTMLIIEEAKRAGFSKIISTSHYVSNQYEFDEASRRQFLELIKIGANNLGIYSYTLSIITIFYLISSLGINTYGQREIAYIQDDVNKRSKLFIELMIIRLFSTILSIILLLILITIETQYKAYYQIFIIYIIANLFDITWLYQGIEKFKTITIRNATVKIIYLISIFIFIKNKNNLSTYIFLFSSMTLLTNLSLWFNIKKLITIPKKIEIKKHLKPVLHFFIPQIASLIYTVVDRSMIGSIRTDIKEVFFYEQASYIVRTILTIITLTNTIMISKISYNYKNNNKEKITNYINNTINFIWLIGTPLSFGVCAIIKNFVPWFYGNNYQNIITLVYLMSPIIIIIGLNNLIGIQFLIPTQNQNKHIIAVSLGTILNVILNLILIKPFGPIGATITSIVSELFILMIELHYFKKIIPNINIFKNSLKYIFFSIIMFVITYYSGNIFNSTIYVTIFQLLIGIISYSILILISKDKFVFTFLKTLKK